MLKRGNSRGLDYLYDSYGGKLYNMSYAFLKSKEDAEEAIQDVLIKVWHNRNKLGDPCSLGGYLFKITKNHLLNKIRDKSRKGGSFVELNVDVADGIRTDQALMMEDMQQILTKAIEGLPQRRQQIFKMSRMAHLTNIQIAIKLGITEKTVENQIGRALKYLRIYLNYTYSILIFLFW